MAGSGGSLARDGLLPPARHWPIHATGDHGGPSSSAALADSPQAAWSLEGFGLIFKGYAAKSRLPSRLLEPLVLRSLVQGLTFRLVKF